MKIIIRAGGTGTRLWPLSRSNRPKQFLPLFEGKSCVQMAYHRFTDAGLAEPEDIYVSIGRQNLQLAQGQLPELRDDNFIVEPAKRDTAAAIGLETVVAAEGDPDVTIASLGSDHYVEQPDEFVNVLRSADTFLEDKPGYLGAIACRPTRVETGYGHIKKGSELGAYADTEVFEVAEFTEKPDYPTAQEYTESGQYLWNANFFVWKSGTVMSMFEELEPEMHSKFTRLLRARREGDFERVLPEVYPTIKKVAVDYALLEPAAAEGKMAVLPVSMGWSDIGNWSSITDAFPVDQDGNFMEGPVLPDDTTDTTVYVDNDSRRLVAAIGVEGLAIVDTEDALLVVPKERSGEVKQLVKKLKENENYSDLT
ncbi:MAG: mannose-1-phosphate guanylyltransferase [Planctomycetota bacterium]